MRRKSANIILCCVFLLLSGCAGRVELNELLIVSAIGVDVKDKQTNVHFQVVNAGGTAGGQGGAPSGGSGGAVYTYTVKGETVYEAVEKASSLLPRKLMFSHVTCVIIGEKYARTQGLSPLFDFFERNHEIRDNMLMLVAKKSDAKSILSMYTPLFKNPAESIKNRVKQSGTTTGVSKAIQVKEAINWIYGEKRDVVIQGIERISLDKKAEETSILENIDANNKTYHINGLAFFKKDKMKGWYTIEETRGWAIISGNVNDMFILTHKCGERKGNVGLMIKDIKSSVTPVWKNGIITYEIDVSGKALLQEVTCSIDVGNPAELKKIENQIEKVLTKEILKTIRKAQKKKVDVFGFGKMLYDDYPVQWKGMKENWGEQFSEAQTDIKVKIILETLGARVESIHGEVK
ncbi:Ger(x)C family spore germination protein [Fictibacillus iocasae]|uniref:Ger(X)C family spore germination protein n=1 Tax=Fictibacillus iocasae TaxID=2715437 RepID=A0ABW2NR92_9BACL